MDSPLIGCKSTIVNVGDALRVTCPTYHCTFGTLRVELGWAFRTDWSQNKAGHPPGLGTAFLRYGVNALGVCV